MNKMNKTIYFAIFNRQENVENIYSLFSKLIKKKLIYSLWINLILGKKLKNTNF